MKDELWEFLLFVLEEPVYSTVYLIPVKLWFFEVRKPNVF